MIGEKWTIYWKEYTANTYLYGSEVVYHKYNDVEFTNNFMPPGTIIKEWFSKTNFEQQRMEPELPIIDGEGEYQIQIDIEAPEGECYLVRLVFYDRYGQEAGVFNIWDKEAEFRCPLKTYSYSMQLINAGVKQLRFHNVVIKEK